MFVIKTKMVYKIGALTQGTESCVYIYDNNCDQDFYTSCQVGPGQRLCLISVYIDLPTCVICPKHSFIVLEEDQEEPINIEYKNEVEGLKFDVKSNIYSYNEIENEFEYC
jgi:hypothetical protein